MKPSVTTSANSSANPSAAPRSVVGENAESEVWTRIGAGVGGGLRARRPSGVRTNIGWRGHSATARGQDARYLQSQASVVCVPATTSLEDAVRFRTRALSAIVVLVVALP